MIKRKIKEIILPFHTLGSLRLRVGWFINLRWFFIFIILAILPLSDIVLNHNFAHSNIYILTGIMMVLNIFYVFLFKYYNFKNSIQVLTYVETQLLIDLIIISFLVHYIGGVSNPFYFLYIIYIIISGILFQSNLPYFNAIFAATVLTVWSILEYTKIVKSYPFQMEELTFTGMIASLLAFYFFVIIITYIITDFVSNYRSLKKLIDKKSILLEQTMAERDKMFRFTAHELKSPITTLRSILGVVRMLVGSEGQEEKIDDMLGRAEKRSDQVLNMVKDMIELTHIKQGKMEEVVCVNYEKWIKDKVDSLKDYADKENIELTLKELNVKKDIYFSTDSMGKVVTNLINNAIRYTHSNGKVEVIPYINSDSFGISVKDNGIGISEIDQKKIFNDFFRSSEARAKEKLGTGLGLSLVKEIVEKMNGNITVSSEVGKGSQFKVDFPM